MRRRLVLLVACVSLVLGSSLVFDPVQADPAASIDDSGWWWRAQSNPTVMVPPPPNVSKGQLMVQSSPEGATALAAIAGTLVEGQANPVLTLKVAANGDTGGEKAVLVACQAGATWKGGDAQAWSEHPPAGCEAGAAQGTRSEDGTSWSFDLSTLQFTDNVNVVIAPGTVDGQPEGANFATFSLTFEPPTTAAIATSPGLPPAPASLPPMDSGFTTPDVGSGATFDSPPADTGSFDLPPAAALPDEAQALTPVAPSVQAGQPLLPASVVFDPRKKEARPVGIALLLLGSALVYLMTRQQQPIGPDGVPGGLGRWASPRWGAPPSLRG